MESRNNLNLSDRGKMGRPAVFTNLFVIQCSICISGLNNLYSCVYETMESLLSIHIVYWLPLEPIYGMRKFFFFSILHLSFFQNVWLLAVIILNHWCNCLSIIRGNSSSIWQMSRNLGKGYTSENRGGTCNTSCT